MAYEEENYDSLEGDDPYTEAYMLGVELANDEILRNCLDDDY